MLAVLSGPDAELEEGGARRQEHFPTLSRPGIIDIGIEYCGTVCSQHHTVWEDPLSLRGAKLLFTLVSLLVSAVG